MAETKDTSSSSSGVNNTAPQIFTFQELATATKNFQQEFLVGEGGFGRIYKGEIEQSGQVNYIIFN